MGDFVQLSLVTWRSADAESINTQAENNSTAARCGRAARLVMSLWKSALVIVGSVCILLGLFLTMVSIDLVQHPRGMGAEKLFVPLFGLVVVGLFVVAAICIYAAVVLKNRPKNV